MSPFVVIKHFCLLQCLVTPVVNIYIGMGIINGTFSELSNTSNSSDLLTIHVAIGISHLLMVAIPSLLISAFVVYYLYILIKTSGVRPILLLYFIISILCITGPSLYSIIDLTKTLLNDASCALTIVHYNTTFGTAMLASYCTAMVAVVQFLVLQAHQKRLITVTKIALFFFVVLFVTAVFNTTLACMNCLLNFEYYIISAVWAIVAFIIPLLLMVIFSILTCVKVRNGVFEESKPVIRSVVRINSMNLLCYIAFRLLGLVIFYIGVNLSTTQSMFEIWKDISYSIANIGYPLTSLSILVLHAKLRKMAFGCKNCNKHRKDESVSSLKITEMSNV